VSKSQQQRSLYLTAEQIERKAKWKVSIFDPFYHRFDKPQGQRALLLLSVAGLIFPKT